MSAFEDALILWIAEAKAIPVASITDARFDLDPGHPGYSEYTPGEPLSCDIYYTAEGEPGYIDIDPRDMGVFISRIAELARIPEGVR